MIDFMKNDELLSSPEWDMLKEEITRAVEGITRKLEKSFGPMPQGYSITINFNSKNVILTQPDNTLMRIKINLPEYAMNSDKKSKEQRLLNLSHELVHTLTPDEKFDEVTVFEEGLATYFSEEYTNTYLMPPKNYANARNLVCQLLKMDKAIVRKLRERHPDKKLSEFTEDDFIDILGPEAPNLSQTL